MTEIIVMGDARVAAIRVEESGEPLVRAGDSGSLLFSELKAADDPTRRMIRKSVLDRILGAQTLLPDGYRFIWVEGQRAASLQEHYFDGYRAELERVDPGLSSEGSYHLASRYVSPPSIAPHVSGAAIDLTLGDDEGNELDLGTAVNKSPEDSAGGCYSGAVNISTAARQHRRLMFGALEEVGLVNYPTEWWHWSYGDRYWALLEDREEAIYGPIE